MQLQHLSDCVSFYYRGFSANDMRLYLLIGASAVSFVFIARFKGLPAHYLCLYLLIGASAFAVVFITRFFEFNLYLHIALIGVIIYIFNHCTFFTTKDIFVIYLE